MYRLVYYGLCFQFVSFYGKNCTRKAFSCERTSQANPYYSYPNERPFLQRLPQYVFSDNSKQPANNSSGISQL